MQEVDSKERIARMVFSVFSFLCNLWVFSFFFIVGLISMYSGGFGKLAYRDSNKKPQFSKKKLFTLVLMYRKNRHYDNLGV